MSVNRENKEKKVAAVGAALKESELVVVFEQNGLNAEQTLELRRAMRAEDAAIKIEKNTLIKHAIKGTDLEGLDPFMRGPTALAYSKDPVAAARVVAEFAKKNKDKLRIIAASMSGKILDEKAAMALAALPSLDELRGKLVGLVQAPATKIAGVLQAPAGQLARVVSAYSKKAG